MAPPCFDRVAATRHLALIGHTLETAAFQTSHWSGKPAESIGPGLSDWGRLDALNIGGHSLWVRAAGARKNDDATALPAVWCEWDKASPAEAADRLRAAIAEGLPAPTCSLTTWAEGSLHVWWRLDIPTADLALAERVMKGLAAVLGADPAVARRVQPMRLAGSLYWLTKKKAKERKAMTPPGTCLGVATLQEQHPERVASLAALWAWLEPRIPAPEPQPPASPQPPLAAPSPSLPGALVTPDDPRTYEELERLVAAYPTILADNKQYPEAIRFIFGLCKAMEEIGRSRDDAIRLASQYHPGASDTFEEARKADISKSQGGSFIKQCKEKGVDTRRHDIKRKPHVDIPPDAQFERPTSNGHRPAVDGDAFLNDLLGESSAVVSHDETAPAKAIFKPVTKAHHRIVLDLPGMLGGHPRLNLRTRDIHVGDKVITPDEAASLYLELSSPYEKWPKEATKDALLLLAQRQSFDPFIDYLDDLETRCVEPLSMEEWSRLDRLLLGIEDPVAAACLPRFFVSAVARGHEPGCIARQWPVLIGPKNIGKSNIVRPLFTFRNLPHGFIDNAGDLKKDGLMKCQRGVCVELAELNGITRRADKEHIKAFLSERVDTFRSPYGYAPIAYPRRFVFWGTSNGPPMNEADPRFVCIRLPDRKLPFDAVAQAKDALWARALQQYRAGFCWHTTSAEYDEALRERNEDHTITDPWAEQVESFLQRRKVTGELPVSVPEVMDMLKIESAHRNNAMAVRVVELAASLGWTKAKRRPAPGLAQRLGLWPEGR